MSHLFRRRRTAALALSVSAALFPAIVLAQDTPATDADTIVLVPGAPTTDEDATVSYPASYFEQFRPFSANDMLDRIPGITVARQGSGGGGGPGSSGGGDRRGLGMGGDQILINGNRITGKGNEGSNQLSRIPAEQVQYIEIIRGTSGDLDVRGGNQVINIVLLESESRSAVAFELNSDQYHDGEIVPGGKVSLSGSRGNFDYMFSAESEPRWEYRTGFETSTLPDGSLNETIVRNTTTDAQPLTLSTNLGWQIGDRDLVHFNAQIEDNDRPFFDDRFITDFQASPPTLDVEFDNTEHSGDSWEVGGDYEHTLAGGQRWKTLVIVNRKEDDSLRERFQVEPDSRSNDLYLATFNRYQERIVRSSYAMDLSASQALEVGLERAQTILDATLQLGLLTGGTTSPAFGGLTPITDTDATVEEIRYEGFAVHNWQINPRMSLESTLIIEQSEISQSGDVSKSRDFDFIRPKVDYRFDLTPALQLRATIEKGVSQLSFNDFTANTDSGDDEQNEIAGNPDLRQEQSWRYDLNLEYRFANDNGVLNSNLYYHDLEDVIDRVPVTTADGGIQSANGNIGDGERYGVAVDGSLRMASLNLPNLLLTTRVEIEDSSVTDPFRGIDRRLSRQGRGSYRLGFRHDITSRSINYGLNFSDIIQGRGIAWDVDKIEEYDSDPFIIAFFEVQGWGGLTYRFEATNFHESYRCRLRSRYENGTIATGTLSEIEDSCSHAGEKYAIKIRGTF